MEANMHMYMRMDMGESFGGVELSKYSTPYVFHILHGGNITRVEMIIISIIVLISSYD
jgi:hypothetical protein